MPIFSMRSKTRQTLPIIGDAVRRIGRGVRRIKFHAGEQAVAKAALDVVGIGVVGEIAGQKRLEIRALRQRRHDPLAIGHAVGRRAHRRHQVRHQDGAAEIFGGERQHRLEHFAVANMQVPVVRLADGDTRGHDSLSYPIGAAAAANVSIGGSSIIAPVRSATRANPRLAHHSSRPSMIAIMPVGLRKVR